MNNEILNSIVTSGIIFCASISCAYLYNIGRILKIIKKKHQKTWEQLGKPTFLFFNTPNYSLILMEYIGKQGYKNLGDNEINTINSRAQKIRIFFLPIYAIIIILLFTLIFNSN